MGSSSVADTRDLCGYNQVIVFSPVHRSCTWVKILPLGRRNVVAPITGSASLCCAPCICVSGHGEIMRRAEPSAIRTTRGACCAHRCVGADLSVESLNRCVDGRPWCRCHDPADYLNVKGGFLSPCALLEPKTRCSGQQLKSEPLD